MRLSAFFLLACLCAPALLAQKAVPIATDLQPRWQSRVTLDALTTAPTSATAFTRADVAGGTLRAQYRIQTDIADAAEPQRAAHVYLRTHAAAFGLDASLQDLDLVDERRTTYATHLRYQQMYKGVPVYFRFVQVNLSAEGRPTMVTNRYATHLRTAVLDVTPAVSEAEARSFAETEIAADRAEVARQTLTVYPSDPPRLAWQLAMRTPAQDWEVLLDAHTRQVIHLRPLSTHAHRTAAPTALARPAPLQPPMARALPAPARTVPPAARRTDGTGLVFDPDPLTSTGTFYGDPIVDNEDRNSPALDAAQKTVALRDLTQRSDGQFELLGPFVNVTDTVGLFRSIPVPTASSPEGFQFPRDDEGFEAVMVYYHMDKSQRYIQSLDIGRPIQQGPIPVNPHGLGAADDSRYTPLDNHIAFGFGGVDDAEDAFVILHEYAHALAESSAPGLLVGFEGRSWHEGWADYWAGSYVRGLIESGAVPVADWLQGFRWDMGLREDGSGALWPGRRFERQEAYPEVLSCCGGSIHRIGLIWPTTMMQIWPEVGQHVLDRLNLYSHVYLMPGMTYRDAGEALVQADLDLYGGAHLGALLRHLGPRGLADASGYGPVITHTPLPDTDEAGSELLVEAEAVSGTVRNIDLVYQVDGAADIRRPLAAVSTQLYSTAFTLPTADATIGYYLEATDAQGATYWLPVDAPQARYRFEVRAGVLTERTNALASATETGYWTQAGTESWVLTPTADSVAVSALVLAPVAVPSNVVSAAVELAHSYMLGTERGGNLSVSANGGATWTVLAPTSMAYPSQFVPDVTHPMQGEPVFSGTSGGIVRSTFNLLPFAGQTIQVRLNFGTVTVPRATESWRIERASFSFGTEEQAFQTAYTFGLETIYPNPARDRATISYTIDTRTDASLHVYDVLGRRVETLAEGMHDAGTYTVRADVALASGVYMVRLETPASQATQQLVVAR
ncbi:MAG: T9SS type A sorting domain-containing protein [Bacteroidota bacterium]